ncbi:dipeptidyl peptidase 3 isoform X2 [Arctopsyche grandis]
MSSTNAEFLLPNSQPVVELDCTAAFNSLTDKEKLYAHHLSRACWTGGLIVLVQTSPESPLIFSMLHRVIMAESLESLKAAVLAKNISEDEWTAFLVYMCGILANAGNYKCMGDTKFIPNIPEDKFKTIVRSSKAYKNNPEHLENLWNLCHRQIYTLTDRLKSLGLGEKGISTYFSENCTMEDANLVAKWMRTKKMEAYISRTCKTFENGTPLYSIVLASVDKDPMPPITIEKESYDGALFQVVRGDYSPLLALVNQNLEQAIQYVANDNEKNMIKHYINSFQRGDLDEHKNGSRYWIKDKGPVIETYLGFIETYRDPSGQRGEFEGFVAMVNKKMSEKFKALVDNAENFLKFLPWGPEFEKDKFLQPDFTSLDVMTFAGSETPAGINIPNYDEIRQSEGFKNVSLGNVIPAHYKDAVTPFLSTEDSSLINAYRVRAFEVQVGLHELLGHGSGKLFYKHADGTHNFDIASVRDPLTGEPISSWYNDGDTYDSQFTSLGSAFEECRAEAVGLYLSLDKSVLKIFGYEGQIADDIIYANWLSLMWNGAAKATEMYQPATKAWLQAHAQARFVLMRLLELDGEGMLQITETEPGKNLLLTLDRTKIETVGKKVIGNFLLKLQILKSTGNADGARKLFAHYSELRGSWIQWRDIVLAHKQPRKMLVKPNSFLKDGSVVLKTYEPSHQGLIQSWVDRFPNTEVDDILEKLAESDKKHYLNLY